MANVDSISGTPLTQSSLEDGTQSKTLSSGLYVVATPIGNLRDITMRALDVLRNVDVILAEDTRQTRKLLFTYNIDTPLTAYHDHNAAKRIPGIIKMLEDGKCVAQVSDAGTPLVSDPGFKLVRAVSEAGYDIIPLPGASAVLAGLVVSGLPTDRFLFAGFLPPKSSARRTELEALTNIRATMVFFESGARLEACLADMRDVFGGRAAVIARELTKRYEEIRRGSFEDLIEGITSDPPRGEIVVLVGPPTRSAVWSEREIVSALQNCLPEMGVKRASAHVAELSGWAKRDVYQRALSLK